MLPFRSRHVCGWSTAVLILLFVFVCAMVGSLAAEAARKPGGKGGRKKQATPTPSAPGEKDQQSLTNVPLPIGHEAKGLILPDFDLDGHLRGKFVAGTARRIDQDHMGFRDLKITTFTPENKLDLQIDMPTSVLDLKTRILSSQDRTTVRRADFNIVGDSIEFDTNTRTGRMIGNVKMVINDQSHLTQKPAAAE